MSFPSFDDEWAGDAGVTNYHDMDAHNDADDDGCYDEYDESGEYDGDWIDVSHIPEDRTFD